MIDTKIVDITYVPCVIRRGAVVLPADFKENQIVPWVRAHLEEIQFVTVDDEDDEGQVFIKIIE